MISHKNANHWYIKKHFLFPPFETKSVLCTTRLPFDTEVTDIQKHVAELHCFSLALPNCLVHSPHSFQSNSSSSSFFSVGCMQCMRRVHSHGTPTVSCLLSVTHQWHQGYLFHLHIFHLSGLTLRFKVTYAAYTVAK